MECSALQASDPVFTSFPRAEGPWLGELLGHVGRNKPPAPNVLLKRVDLDDSVSNLPPPHWKLAFEWGIL